jgi:predicted phage terminase large subunit-like protein
VTATLSLDVRRRAARKFVEQSGTGRPTEFPTAGSLAYELDRTTRNPPHLKLLDQALLDADRGGCKRLIVSMPPQEGKSERLSHYGVLWWLRRHPDHRVVIASNTKELADGWGRAIRNDIVQNPWLGLTVRQDSRAAGRWQLVGRKGGVYSAGIEGSITGKPADFMVIDDPIKNRKQADSEDFRKACWNFWTDVARTRLHPHSVVIVILTRWHEDDLAGRLVENGPDQWRVINLPAVAEENDPLGRAPGEPLQSAAGRDLAEYEQIRRDVGARTWQALYQGRPSPAEGGMFKRGWWSYYPASPAYELPSGEMWVDGPVQLVQSWDMAFKNTATSDYVVGQVWALEGARAFLLDQVHDRMDFVATCQALRALSAKWPQAHAKLVEDKANGPAVISTLRQQVPGLIPVEPDGSKEARAFAVTPFVEAGNVWLPRPENAPWVHDFVEELAGFPNASNDDQVDAASQALKRLLIDGAVGGPAVHTEPARDDLALVGAGIGGSDDFDAERMSF